MKIQLLPGIAFSPSTLPVPTASLTGLNREEGMKSFTISESCLTVPQHRPWKLRTTRAEVDQSSIDRFVHVVALLESDDGNVS